MDVDMNDAKSIMAECRRLRLEKKLITDDISAAAGLGSDSYRMAERRGVGKLKNAIRWLECIRAMTEGSPKREVSLGHTNARGLTAPTDPRAYLERCLVQDEARLLFLQTQADEVEKRIAQTRAALACFPDANTTAARPGPAADALTAPHARGGAE